MIKITANIFFIKLRVVFKTGNVMVGCKNFMQYKYSGSFWGHVHIYQGIFFSNNNSFAAASGHKITQGT